MNSSLIESKSKDNKEYYPETYLATDGILEELHLDTDCDPYFYVKSGHYMVKVVMN